jgi:hypothetical protein
MNDAIRLYLKEAIEMELNVGDVYLLFSAKFPKDYDFWWKISMEELNHAALIESINDVFLPDSSFPMDSIDIQAEDLRKVNLSIREKIEEYKLISPSRLEAFNYGFELENSAAEFHFEHFMTTVQNSPIVEIFQKLNGDDVNHAARIYKYMKDNNIS